MAGLLKVTPVLSYMIGSRSNSGIFYGVIIGIVSSKIIADVVSAVSHRQHKLPV